MNIKNLSSKIYFFFLFSSFVFADPTRGYDLATKAIQKMQMQNRLNQRLKLLPEKYSFLKSIEKKTRKKEKVLLITYLTSESVPISSHESYSFYAKKIQNVFDIHFDMCMIGVEGTHFNDFLSDVMMKMSGDDFSSMGMNFCPQLFEDLNISRVPAYVVSVCENSYTHTEECAPKYILQGDVDLKFVLEKLSDENRYFKDFYEVL